MLAKIFQNHYLTGFKTATDDRYSQKYYKIERNCFDYDVGERTLSSVTVTFNFTAKLGTPNKSQFSLAIFLFFRSRYGMN